jgi:hypothetical protein
MERKLWASYCRFPPKHAASRGGLGGAAADVAAEIAEAEGSAPAVDAAVESLLTQ